MTEELICCECGEEFIGNSGQNYCPLHGGEEQSDMSGTLRHTIVIHSPEPVRLTLVDENERDVVYWNLIHLQDTGIIDSDLSITRHSEPEGVDIVLSVQ